MLVSTGDLPTGDGWSYEVKWDGFRAVAHITNAGVTVSTRHGKSLTVQFPELQDVGDVPAGTVLDGELVVPGVDGRPVFGEVRRRMALRNPKLIKASVPAMLMVFDVPVLAGLDVCREPLTERRKRLADGGCLEGAYRQVDVHPDGQELMRATRDVGLEGVVAKRNASIYRPGSRSTDWVKFKHHDVTAMHVVAVRRKAGRVEAVLVAGADEKPIGWLDNWSTHVTRALLAAGIPDGDGVVWGDGPIVAVRHLLTPGLREPMIVATRPRP